MAAKVSINPNRMPPAIAPPMLPSPPSVAATKAFMAGRKPMLKDAYKRSEQHPGATTEHAADPIGVSRDAREIDAHQLSRFRTLGGCLHGAACSGESKEELQQHHEENAKNNDPYELWCNS